MISGRFQPGVSGNPAGRPKNEKSITNMLRQKLTPDMFWEKFSELLGHEDPYVRLGALKYAADRVDGRPSESHDVTIQAANVAQAEEWLGENVWSRLEAFRAKLTDGKSADGNGNGSNHPN